MTTLAELGEPEFSVTRTKKLDTTPHYVYVVYGARERVLYVGVTRNVPGRMASHRKKAEWWNRVARIDFFRAESRKRSWEIEVDLIGELRPECNVAAGNWWYLRNTPDEDVCGTESETVEVSAA